MLTSILSSQFISEPPLARIQFSLGGINCLAIFHNTLCGEMGQLTINIALTYVKY